MSDDAKGYTVLAEHLAVAAAAHGFYAGDMEYHYYRPDPKPDLRAAGDIEAALWHEIEALRAQLAVERSERQALADRLARVELGRCACTDAERAEWQRVQKGAK